MAKTCEKCGCGFPSTMKIDGKWKVLNKRKYCLTCSPWKEHNTKQLKISSKEEKICPRCEVKKSVNDFYVRGGHRTGASTYCRLCSKEEASERQRVAKRRCVEYKGGKCQSCGYDRCLDALEFHHVNKEDKEFGICGHKSLGWEKIKEELDKCVLVCCLCHREIEARIRSCPEICLSGATG